MVMPEHVSSWVDWVYPEWRKKGPALTVEGWLRGRRAEEGAEDLWRVHDDLYDLSAWISHHPGGPQWIRDTKGTDITEAFESHHIGPNALNTLHKFFVRPAKTKRNSPFTFKPDGFYRTIKSKAWQVLQDVEPGPSAHSKRLLEALAASTVALSVSAAVCKSLVLATLAGTTLTLTAVCAHNFFHMRDNWRMYCFNLSLLSARQWRISHALSHHMYPNTHHDLEICFAEPFLEYFPIKTQIFGLISAIYSPLIYPFTFIVEGLKRTLLCPPHLEDLLGLILPALMLAAGGDAVLHSLTIYLAVLLSGGFVFTAIGLNAAHHHPDIFHNGDKPREDRDWGLYTLDATRDRVEICSNTNLALLTFGDHTLHHLFPTVDHAHLPRLYPVLEETCRQFSVEFRTITTWQMIKGQFQQLMRHQPNLKAPT